MVTISLINWADIEMIINYMQRLKISILSIRIINKSALFYLRSTSKEKQWNIQSNYFYPGHNINSITEIQDITCTTNRLLMIVIVGLD